jgi:hypothetical protein
MPTLSEEMTLSYWRRTKRPGENTYVQVLPSDSCRRNRSRFAFDGLSQPRAQALFQWAESSASLSGHWLSGTVTIICAIATFVIYNAGHLSGDPMLSSLSSLQIYLWFAGILAQCLLAGIIINRKAYSRFPWFCIYIFQSSLASLALLWVGNYSTPQNYGRAYYAESILDAILALFVISEFFVAIFGPARLPRAITRASEVLPKKHQGRPRILTMYLAGSLLAAYTLTASIGSLFWADSAWRRGEQMFLSLAVATLWVIFLFKERLGLFWSARVAGIGRGLLIYLTTEAFTAYINGRAGVATARLAIIFSQLSFLIAVSLWRRGFLITAIPLRQPTSEELSVIRSLLGEGAGQGQKEKSRGKSAW